MNDKWISTFYHMTTLFARVGGKSRLAEKVVEHFIEGYENMVYVEPFVGGGSVFFKKNKCIGEVINDLDKTVYTIYKGFKKFKPEKIMDAVNGEYSKDDYERIMDSKPRDMFGKFVKEYILTRISFFGRRDSYSGSRNKISLKRDQYYDRLKDVIILNKSYEELLKNLDGPNAFFYLDPPYEGSDRSHYKHWEFDHELLRKRLDEIEGKFCLSLNDSKRIREIFKGYRIVKVHTKYTDPVNGGQVTDVSELLIMNY